MGAYLLLIIFFFISFLIVGLVLLQEGKGGGLTGMSAGMDGVMGAKNPLRRMTAYLFAIFVVLCLGINWYYHDQSKSISELPAGAPLEQFQPQRTVEENAPSAGPLVVPGALRPEDGDNSNAAPIRPEGSDALNSPVAEVRHAAEEVQNAAAAAREVAAESSSALRPAEDAVAGSTGESVKPNN